MGREAPIRELGDETRLARQQAMGDDQPSRRRLFGLVEPNLELDATSLGKEKVPGGFAVDRDGVEFSAARYVGQEHLSWIDIHEVREGEVDVEEIADLSKHGFDLVWRIAARVFVLVASVEGHRLSVVVQIGVPIVSATVHHQSIR